jgi:hypothetical protein
MKTQQGFSQWPDSGGGIVEGFWAHDRTVRIDRPTLARIVLEAVPRLADPIPPAQTTDAEEPSAWQLLTLLTYCYAAGIYGWRDIELNLEQDEVARRLCADAFPEFNAIRHFRRCHRSRIKARLAAVLREISGAGWTNEGVDHDARSARAGFSLARAAGPGIDRRFDEAAEACLDRAARADSMMLDA